MPGMADERFARSVIYLCAHSEDGAMGIIVNQASRVKNFPELLVQLNVISSDDLILLPQGAEGIQVLTGGPVQTDRGFVLHGPGGPWQSTLTINRDIGLTTSKDILQAVARGDGPEQIFVTLGYAGWSAGQIESELAQNAWLTVPADKDVLFALPCEERVPAAMHLLGIDFASLSEEAGHA